MLYGRMYDDIKTFRDLLLTLIANNGTFFVEMWKLCPASDFIPPGRRFAIIRNTRQIKILSSTSLKLPKSTQTLQSYLGMKNYKSGLIRVQTIIQMKEES